MILKNKKAELAAITVIVLTIALISSIVLLNQFRGITGFATLNLSDVSDYNESIRLEFNEAGDQIVYLDLDNYDYTSASFDITGLSLNITLNESNETTEFYPLNPVIDILNNGEVDWNYSEEFSSTETISFVSILNNYISNCGLYPCPVPIKITVESPGQIVLDNFVLEYEYIVEEEILENITEELIENITEEINATEKNLRN